MKPEDDPWKRLVDATKTAPVDEDESHEDATEVNVKNLRENVQALLLTLTWSRWSLLAAAIAGLVFLIFYLTREPSSPRPPIIPTESPDTLETP